jgi:hypothetical protein
MASNQSSETADFQRKKGLVNLNLGRSKYSTRQNIAPPVKLDATLSKIVATSKRAVGEPSNDRQK